MRLLFLHGAGGFIEDRAIADGLGSVLGADVDMPEFPDADMSFEGWARPIRGLLEGLGSQDIVVAHSFGASVLVRVLAEKVLAAPSRATLLAMPDWSPEGWDVAEYAMGSPPETALTLHHCLDDEVVPFEHLRLTASTLPSARTYVYPSGGHQFAGRVEDIAATILQARE